LFKIKPPARRTYAPEGHVKKISAPVSSAGHVPAFSRGLTGRKDWTRLNIKYGFNPDGIKRKINSIGQAGQANRPFMDGHQLNFPVL